MKETGKMIYKMDTELKLGQMDQDMREIIRLVKSTGKELILGLMVPNM